jgi:hypothetical protein
LFVETVGSGNKWKTAMLTTDPNARVWASQHQVYSEIKVGGLSVAANMSPSETWKKGVACEFYTPR